MRSYCPSVYGSAAYLAPTGVVGVPRHHLSSLQARAKVATKWLDLFAGQQCRFSNQFLRVLSQSGLHNMGGSDEGMKTIIAGVIKGLAEEVGLPLVCVSLGTREPISLYIGPLFVSLIHVWECQDNGALRLHVIGPAARCAPSGGMPPLLVPLCYD